MSAIFLNQEIVHYEVLGRGRPLIFLHSWVGSWRYWIPTMQAASISYRTYAVDLWGFGDTANTTEQYSLENQIKLIDNFLENLGIFRIALIGHGLGAIIAMLYTQRHPDIVDRVMAVSYPLQSDHINSKLYSDTPQSLTDWLLNRNNQTEPVWAEIGKTDIEAIKASLADLANCDLYQLWYETNTASLLVHGQNDPAISPPDNAILAKIPAQSHQILFEESAHFPMLDNSNKFNRLLLDFLNLKSGESPQQLQLKEEWKRRIR